MVAILQPCSSSFASPLPTVGWLSSSSFSPICCSSLASALPHLILSTSANPLLIQAPRERTCLTPTSLSRTIEVFHHPVKQSKWTRKWKIWMKLPNRLSKISASASIHHPPVSDRMLSKSKPQTSSPAAAKARLAPAKHASTSQEASACLNAISKPPQSGDIPQPPQESKPPDAKTTQSTRKITHQFHQTPHPQVPAPHVASVSLGVPCIVLVRLTPSPYVKKKKTPHIPFRLCQIPPSSPIHSVSPSYGHSVSIVVRWVFICCGAVSQQKGVIRQWWQAVCAGVFSSSRHRRGAASRRLEPPPHLDNG